MHAVQLAAVAGLQTVIMVHIAPLQLPCCLARQPCPAALPGRLAEILQY
jgi:hypothetical protein